jgi:hypothetical protein
VSSKPEQLCEELQASLAGTIQGLTFAFGGKALDAHSNTPRVVWRVASGTFGGTPRPGLNPRPLFNRLLMLEAHLWGDDYGATEALLEAVCRAMQKAASGSFQPLKEQWPTEDDKQRSARVKGCLCILTFSVMVPVTAAPDAVATVTAATFDTSTSSPTDGQLDAGEP